MTSPFLPQWTVPDPPPSGERAIQPGMAMLGIVAAVLGHVIAGVIGLAGLAGAVGDGLFSLLAWPRSQMRS